MKKIVELQTTLPDMKSALTISNFLVEQGFIACSNIIPTTSIYSWEEKMQQENECLLLVKTSLHQLPDLVNQVKKIHPYQLPAIVHFEVNTTDEYGDWVEQQTRLKPVE